MFEEYAKLLHEVQSTYNAPSFERRYVVGGVNLEAARSLKQEIEEGFVPSFFSIKSYSPRYFAVEFERRVEDQLIRSLTYYQPSQPSARLDAVIAAICVFAEKELKHPVKVVNTRIWTINKTALREGPNAWHTDGMAPGVYKVMCYLTAPSRQTGTTEIKNPDGSLAHVKGEDGTVLLFDNSGIEHRGVPPTDESLRFTVEVTLIPCLGVEDHTPVFAGTNAQYPISPGGL